MKGISIILCCYNSSARLPETLRHLSLQRVPKTVAWEVILVNNASKDNTVEVAEALWNTYGPNKPTLQIVDQPIPGLSYAREKGFQTAQYDYLLFCDDDNWLSEDYVRIAFEVMDDNPLVGALGGWGSPICEIEPPSWFTDYSGTYATGPQGDQSGEVKVSYHVYGAGAVYRKLAIDHLKSCGFEYKLTGRTAASLSVGEDHELCYAMVLAGYKIWYDERLTFKHFIPKERLTWKYLKGNLNGIANAYPILKAYKIAISHKFKTRSKIKCTWQWLVFVHVLFIFRKKITKIIYGNRQKGLLLSDIFYELKVFYSNREKYTNVLKILSQRNWTKNQYEVIS